MPEHYLVGKIVNTHGIRGEVRVVATTDFPEARFRVGSALFVETTPETPVTVAGARVHKGFTLLRFDGYTDINQVLAFKGHDLTVAAKDQQPLEEGSYYYRDIIGLTVIDQDQQVLGQVSEILSPGANDVWVIPRTGQPDILLPFLTSVVKTIDLAQKTAVVEVPEGLIDDAD